ncbi:MAG: hypothetical protein V5A31_03520 [Haloferacaceae archaeon]|jgi:hypothetical protein
MPSTDRSPGDPAAHARRVARPAARWVARGAVAGVVVAGALLIPFSARGATDTAFALGALVLGFGVTAWSGTVGLGESLTRMQELSDVDSGWTQVGARRAFAVLSWVGSGWALGAVAASVALVG